MLILVDTNILNAAMSWDWHYLDVIEFVIDDHFQIQIYNPLSKMLQVNSIRFSFFIFPILALDCRPDFIYYVFDWKSLLIFFPHSDKLLINAIAEKNFCILHSQDLIKSPTMLALFSVYDENSQTLIVMFYWSRFSMHVLLLFRKGKIKAEKSAFAIETMILMVVDVGKYLKCLGTV